MKYISVQKLYRKSHQNLLISVREIERNFIDLKITILFTLPLAFRSF